MRHPALLATISGAAGNFGGMRLPPRGALDEKTFVSRRLTLMGFSSRSNSNRAMRHLEVIHQGAEEAAFEPPQAFIAASEVSQKIQRTRALTVVLFSPRR